MDSLNFDLGIVRLAINGDETNFIEFNPSDHLFAEKFYRLRGEMDHKFVELKQKAEKIDENKQVDEFGIPANAEEQLAFVREACMFVREKIDQLFGDGTSQKAFGDALVMEAYTQFLNGITPYFEKARNKKLAGYITENSKVLK